MVVLWITVIRSAAAPIMNPYIKYINISLPKIVSSDRIVHGCPHIISARSYSIPPQNPMIIFTRAIDSIFAIMIFGLLHLDLNTKVAVLRSNSSPRLFAPRNIIRILAKFP